MRQALIFLAALILLLGLVVIGYIAITPKVLLVNESSNAYDEFIVALPSSRVSFGPIAPTSSQSIYFSKQSTGGTLKYSLLLQGNELAHGTLQYDANGQYFRSIRFVIGTDGAISARVSG
jgi:hypothetical protein